MHNHMTDFDVQPREKKMRDAMYPNKLIAESYEKELALKQATMMSAPTPSGRWELEVELERLDHMISATNEAVQRLDVRCQPLLRPIPPQPVGPESGPIADAPSSMILGVLRNMRAKLEAVQLHVHDLADRIGQ